ncbi:hypothetical protein Tsubulata_006916 [Turnera subulata]|uniref:Kazal-like domain-containing protein n=1 Tax=Turnera subulata TaxID=218843 RepID=A0A9Q0JP53_9ROSI|nr:hypothetical protein Tsubulata_006916 [Turnera subulata]
MATSKNMVAPLCLLMVLVFGLMAQSDGQQDDVCAGVPRPPPESIPCAFNCLIPRPVCGADGVTYTCGCEDAFCRGVFDIVKEGKC